MANGEVVLKDELLAGLWELRLVALKVAQMDISTVGQLVD